MTIWTVYLHGEPEFASDKYFDAKSRANFLENAGYSEVEIKCDLEQKVYDFIKDNPGTRKRYIASAVGTTILAVHDALRTLEYEGTVRRVYHHDPANMEFYDEYYIVE